MDEKPIDRDGESISDTDTKQLSNHQKFNHTISILTTYAFPKTSQYYSSKGKKCILDQYHNEIIEYFITSNINIDNFYNLSINKSEFVSSAIQYITNKTPTNNIENIQNNNYNLQRAVKKLYTIMHTHQHINHTKSLSEPILDMIEEIKFHNLDDNSLQKNSNNMPHQTQTKQRRNSIKDGIVHELSRAKSEVIILKEVADETQKRLTETEQEKLELKRRISQVEEKKEEILFVNRKLTDENEQLRQTIIDLKNKHNVNVNNYNETDENTLVSDNMNINRGHSLSLSSYYHQSNVNIECNDSDGYNENDTTQLLELNENDMNNLSKFYKNMKVKKKKKKNFWERLFEDFKCIPSLN